MKEAFATIVVPLFIFACFVAAMVLGIKKCCADDVPVTDGVVYALRHEPETTTWIPVHAGETTVLIPSTHQETWAIEVISEDGRKREIAVTQEQYAATKRGDEWHDPTMERR
jgi:hypothetical protein